MWWLDERPLAGNGMESILSTPTEQKLWVHLLAIQSHAEEAASDTCGDLPACTTDEPAPQQSQLQASEEVTELARHLEIETELRLAAETQLEAANLQHAEQLAALRLQIQTLEESVQQREAAQNELVAAANERDAEHATQLAELDQTHQASEAALRESESQRATEANSLRSELKLLQEEAATLKSRLAAEIEGRVAAESAIEQCREVHAAECIDWQTQVQTLSKTLDTHEVLRRDSQAAAELREAECSLVVADAVQARESAQQQAAQLAAQLAALELDRGTLQVNLEKETQGRTIAETECRELESQHAGQIEALQAKLLNFETLARDHEAARLESESLLAQFKEGHAAELAKLSDEVRRLNDEAEAARGCYEDLQRHCAEQRHLFVSDAARLQQDLDVLGRQLSERHEQKAALDAQLTELRSQADAARASQMRVEQEAQQLTEELTGKLAEETQQRLVPQGQITDLQTECARQKHELAASRDEISQLQKRVDAFRGLAQREAAVRKKLEMAIKRAGDGTGDSLLATRANLEVHERIRRLTTELTAARNQELSVRQRAMQEIKQAHEEIRLLKDQLANEQKAA